MAIPFPTRAPRWATLAVMFAAGAVGRAESPTVEMLHGTTKVTPLPAEWEPRSRMAPASTGTPEPRVVPAGGAPASLPLATPAPAEALKSTGQTVVVIREPLPAPAPIPQPAAAPTVVVVREPEPRADSNPAAAARPASDWLLAGAVAVGLLGAAVVLRRPVAAAPVSVVLPAAPAPAPPMEPVLPLAEPVPAGLTVGGLDAGPPPNTAQKFDAGPTFQEEKKAHEKQEAEQGAAVLEFILGQNLALRDALDAGAA